VGVRRTHHALVIGARGALGAQTVRAFHESGWEVTGAARAPRAGEVYIDLDRPASIAAAIDAFELVVNTVPHVATLPERLTLERGGVLINTSALPAAAGRSLRAQAGGARGTVVMNAGLAPGVTNLVAADLLHAHPDADELEIALTVSGGAPRGQASAAFIHRGLTALDRHRTTAIPLPEPFGERRCLGFGEDDAGWLGGIAEGRLVRAYVCIAEGLAHEQLLTLNRLHAMTSMPRSVLTIGTLMRNGATSTEPVAHWIAAKRRERRLEARTIECAGDLLHAARCTVLFADSLLTRERPAGCFDPEELWTLPELEPELERAGVRIKVRSAAAKNVC
jgi:NAD dependent epimerase/dehydratase family